MMVAAFAASKVKLLARKRRAPGARETTPNRGGRLVAMQDFRNTISVDFS